MTRVLVVDDEEAVRTMLTLWLSKRGFSVVTADCAASGIASLEREHPDAVITDLRMDSPGAGFEVVQAAAARVPRPVIVILTAFPVPASDWRDTGADALVVKGSRIAGLIQELEILLRKRAASSSGPR